MTTTTTATTNSSIRDLTKQVMEEQGLSLRELAETIGYSQPALSQYLSGTYRAGGARIEAALEPWLRRHHRAPRAGSGLQVTPIETKASEAITEACTAAYETGALIAIIGPPGCGKSMGLRQWEAEARRSKWSFISLQANVVSTSVTLIRRIAEELGIRGGNAASLLDRIVAELQHKPSFLIIDEAQHLNFKALETLRAICDATLTGVALSGSIALERTLLFGDTTSSELAQLQDRIVEVVRVQPLTPVEVNRFVKRMLPVPMDAESLGALREVSRSVPRRVVRVLTHLAKLVNASNATVTAAMVKEAAERLVVA